MLNYVQPICVISSFIYSTGLHREASSSLLEKTQALIELLQSYICPHRAAFDIIYLHLGKLEMRGRD